MPVIYFFNNLVQNIQTHQIVDTNIQKIIFFIIFLVLFGFQLETYQQFGICINLKKY